MDIKQEYETPEDLLDFVLSECGDMHEYEYDDGHIGNTSPYIIIPMNFDAQRVFYAISLLKEHFSITIKDLYLEEDNLRIEEGYLDKTELEEIYTQITTQLPKLPNTIKKITYTKDPTDASDIVKRVTVEDTNDIYRVTVKTSDKDLLIYDDDNAPDLYAAHVNKRVYKFTSLEEALEKARE